VPWRGVCSSGRPGGLCRKSTRAEGVRRPPLPGRTDASRFLGRALGKRESRAHRESCGAHREQRRVAEPPFSERGGSLLPCVCPEAPSPEFESCGPRREPPCGIGDGEQDGRACLPPSPSLHPLCRPGDRDREREMPLPKPLRSLAWHDLAASWKTPRDGMSRTPSWGSP